LAANASEALLAQGRTAQAAVLIDPLTSAAPGRYHWVAHECRAEIDLLRGDIDAAAQRRRQIRAATGQIGSSEFTRETAQQNAELALWAGRPSDAVQDVQRVLPLVENIDPAALCGRLLVLGMRACADLAERARPRRDEPGIRAAMADGRDLVSWVDQRDGLPFADHPFAATIPAERATWDAERTRLAGRSDPDAWGAAAKAWHDLGCPHRAGYAWWRHAEAQLDTGQPATAAAGALQAAAAVADGARAAAGTGPWAGKAGPDPAPGLLGLPRPAAG
jgi:hypothetical protein